MSGLTVEEINELVGKPRNAPSVERADKMAKAQVLAFEERMFACKSVNECAGIASEIRTSMTSGELTGTELVVVGQLLLRCEKQKMSLAGLEPDAPAYEDRYSSKSPNPEFQPTDEQLKEVERFNTQRDRDNNAQRFMLDMMGKGFPAQSLTVFMDAHKDKGTEFPDEGQLRTAMAKDPFARPIRETFSDVKHPADD